MAFVDVGVQRDAALVVLARPPRAGPGAGADAERQPATADPLHAARGERQQRRVTVGDVGHERAEPDRRRRRRERAEQRERLEHRSVAAEHRPVEVVEHPRGRVAVVLGLPDGVAQRRPVVAPALNWMSVITVRAVGLEPTLLAEQGPKPCAAASYATPAASRSVGRGAALPLGTSDAVAFSGFPAEAVAFYEGLAADNSRTYWLEHKPVYERSVRAPMEALLDELAPFGPFHVFRPNRDVRFAKDKTPYKEQIGAFGESEGGAGYYVHFSTAGMLAGSGYY